MDPLRKLNGRNSPPQVLRHFNERNSFFLLEASPSSTPSYASICWLVSQRDHAFSFWRNFWVFLLHVVFFLLKPCICHSISLKPQQGLLLGNGDRKVVGFDLSPELFPGSLVCILLPYLPPESAVQICKRMNWLWGKKPLLFFFFTFILYVPCCVAKLR